MADQYVTVRAHRSKFFGSDGTYVQRGNGTTVKNLDSDFFWQRIIDDGVVEELMARKPPLGPRDDIREGVKGYVAGWNKYLDDIGGPAGITDPSCKGKPWVTKITEVDAYRRFYQLILLASQAVAIDGIANAAPVTGTFQPPAADAATVATQLKEVFPKGGIGSNAVAIGNQGMEGGKGGLVLGNPHFPWLGTERFYQFQMTIPKKVNVSGAGLFGVPLALIGYTDNLAWSHTVSTAYRFTPFQLTIDPTDDTRYIVDGQSEAMTPKHVTVDLGDGKTASRTLWWTRYGPVFTSLVGVPLPWTNATAFAMKDANGDNFRAFNHFIATDQAQSTQQLLGILKQYQGIPWVNTIAADRKGNALYADIGSIPNVSDDHARGCNTALGQALTADIGLPVLDGSRSPCDWENDPDGGPAQLVGGAEGPGRGGPGTLGPEPGAVPAPQGLRDELERLVLAVEPAPAARGLRAHHRRPAHGAQPAHAHGARWCRGDHQGRRFHQAADAVVRVLRSRVVGRARKGRRRCDVQELQRQRAEQ